MALDGRGKIPARLLPGNLTGIIAANGTITAGSGFTVNHSGTGVYVLTFSPALSATPVFVPFAFGGNTAEITVAATVSAVTINVLSGSLAGSLTDGVWNFYAVIPQ